MAATNGFTHRLSGEPIPPQRAPAEKPRPLCILACRWCNEVKFWAWIRDTQGLMNSVFTFDKEGAAEFIKKTCHAQSRKDLDNFEMSGKLFKRLIREPYMKWLEKTS